MASAQGAVGEVDTAEGSGRLAGGLRPNRGSPVGKRSDSAIASVIDGSKGVR
jgi:hypothetical protein